MPRNEAEGLKNQKKQSPSRYATAPFTQRGLGLVCFNKAYILTFYAFLANFFYAKLTLASLRQGGGKIEDFDGGSSSFSESYFHVEREDGILPYGVGANNVR